MTDTPFTILCLATDPKGFPLLEECKRQGAYVILLTRDKWRGADWPWASLDEVHFRPDLRTQPDVTLHVASLARQRRLDQIIALDDYDVETVAALRGHLQIDGMLETAARRFRDKLAMRVQARRAGILAPDFVAAVNGAEIADFLRRVPPPWMLKPRDEAGAIGLRKLHGEHEVWDSLAGLGDRHSYYLLEQFIEGDVFHVDSIVADGRVLFTVVNQYGRPPMSVLHQGGIFSSFTLPRRSETAQALSLLAREVVEAMGLARGVAHTEFIQRRAGGRLFFLETAARVGGAHLDRLIEAATGLNPWTEWARLELAQLRGETYHLPPTRDDYAGLLICLARQEAPDLAAYGAPEIVWRLARDYHAGLLVASPDPDRVQALLAEYGGRFATDFLAYQPPPDKGDR